jgi:hypothetical protein
VDITVRVMVLRLPVDCFVPAAPAVKRIVEKAVAVSPHQGRRICIGTAKETGSDKR